MSSAVNLVSQTDLASAADASSRVPSKTLGQSDFLKIMVAQMQQQDPNNAQDTDKMMQNFMNLSNFQSMQDMDISISRLYQQNQQIYAQNLVGSTVQVSDDNGNLTTGVVQGAYVTTDSSSSASASSAKTKVMITVNGTDYDAANIAKIIQASSNSSTSTTTQS